MIVNHDYKFVFVQIPHTGSTEIGRFLVEELGSEEILLKHSYLHELFVLKPKIYKNYFIFGAKRNPLDERVSIYSKYCSNHLGLYSKPENKKLIKGNYFIRQIANDVRTNNLTYEEYFLKYINRAYLSPVQIHQSRYDAIMKFETLQEDFSSIMEYFKISSSKLQHSNKTNKPETSFMDYYRTNEIRSRALKCFGYSLNALSYEMPFVKGHSQAIRIPYFSIFSRYLQWSFASAYKWGQVKL